MLCGVPGANPATVPACGLTAARPLEGPLGNDSTGQVFPRSSWDVCTAPLAVSCTVPRNELRLPIAHIVGHNGSEIKPTAGDDGCGDSQGWEKWALLGGEWG